MTTRVSGSEKKCLACSAGAGRPRCPALPKCPKHSHPSPERRWWFAHLKCVAERSSGQALSGDIYIYMPTTDQHATLRDRHLLDGGDGSAGPAKSFDHSLRRARAIKVSRGRGVSLWLLGKGCRPGRGLSLSLWFLGGLPPEHRARSIARGKLCSGAVSTCVHFRQCGALCETHRDAARDVIEQEWICAPIPVA